MPIDSVTKYAKAVLANREPACIYIKQACQRHLEDLDREDIYFDADHAESVFKIIGLCRHIKGELAGQPIILHPSQKFIIGSIFGWFDLQTDFRRYRTAYIELPRKNGKSTLLSAVALYMLCADGEQGAEIYAAATKEEQAKIVWETAWHMVKSSPSLSKGCINRHNSILFPTTTSKFRPLGADSKTLDGLNPHAVIADELHAWPKRELWDVLEDSLGSRTQPLMVAITTAGFDKFGICYQQRKHCIQVLDPKSKIEDDRYFSFIATVDEEDLKKSNGKWSAKVWRKANPLLGTAKNLDYMHDQAAKAKAMPGKENAFLNKQLNVWTDGEKKWLDMRKWDACPSKLDPEALRGELCYGGLDLSSNNDLTAFVLAFPPNDVYEQWSLICKFYMPGDNVREKEKTDKVPYQEWIDQGLITATDGDIIDMEYIRKDVEEAATLYRIDEIGFDPWRATELATQLQNNGLEMVAMRQGHATLAPPTSALEKFISKKELNHGDNPVLRWMASNATTRSDANSNIIPNKQDSFSRIDGIFAALNALGRGILKYKDHTSIYEKRGVRQL